ncbi:hypothetical protein [Alkalihalobacillus sp. TS-13]|uniref:hypothetical protein n=1 Tax=Alkalihalobacillus sp. TS-13 TaxID=2842455 RepID=UPI001C87FFD2|nr:hypothetical protein [Alkalihalobacillus sp. TS-13]
MDKQPGKNRQYQFETDGEMEVQQQIMQSYQSGVIDQTSPQNVQKQHKEDENHLT